MGLVRHTEHPGGAPPFTPKHAYNATKVMSRATAGFAFVERVKVFQNGIDDDDDWLLLFTRPATAGAGGPRQKLTGSAPRGSHDTLLVGWTTASFEHVARLPGVGAGCWDAIDWLGNAQPRACHDPRGLHIMLRDGPQYLLKRAN